MYMAASYQVLTYHGSGPTSSAWTDNGRFHRGDSDPTTDGATTPTPIPTSGTNYSWKKFFKLNVTATPVGSVANLRFFSDGVSWGTGITAYAAPSSIYSQPGSGDNTTLITGGTDVTTYTSGSPLVINSGPVLVNPITGTGIQNYLMMQVGGTSSAAPGTILARTMTYRVDET
jgi:hypothetical protein